MPKTGKEHAYGPYENRNGWRIVLVRADGERVAKVFASKAEANAVLAEARNATDTRAIGDLVTEYLAHLRANGVVEGTITTTRYRLLAMLRLKEGDSLLRTFNTRQARRLYARRVAEVAADTHRGELGCCDRAWEFARVKRGWVATNPWEGIEPEGTPSAGKPQLRADEARRLMSVLVFDTSQESTAVMMALLMGLRAHEVVERIGRDVDNGGRLLWVSKSKTRAGERQIAIPSLLRGRLLELKRLRGEIAPLFRMTRHALHYHTLRFAKLAGVPRVTPHGLRGTFATLALTGGPTVTAGALAPQFGHADDGETMRRHYLAPGAEQSANVVKLEAVLGPEETHDAN